MPNYAPEKSNLQVVGETLLELGMEDRDIVVVTSDSRGSANLTQFGKILPDQIVEVGIAEQNLVGVSAGLAAMGKKVFTLSPASFLSARALEQIKNDVAYSNMPVKLIGISGGLSYGALGSTHHSTHDFAALLAINNLDVVVPFDNSETRAAVIAAASHPKPLYMRLGRNTVPNIQIRGNGYSIGKSITLREGHQAYIIACGEAVLPALQASDLLAEVGIACGVVSMHTLRPFDYIALERIAATCQALVTCEEHSAHGGLGSICVMYLMQNRHCLPFKAIAIPDEPIKAGSQQEAFEYYGLHKDAIANQVKSLLG